MGGKFWKAGAGSIPRPFITQGVGGDGTEGAEVPHRALWQLRLFLSQHLKPPVLVTLELCWRTAACACCSTWLSAGVAVQGPAKGPLLAIRAQIASCALG